MGTCAAPPPPPPPPPVPKTEGCITKKDDDQNIPGCTCHADCKLCGYGTAADFPDKADQCITCKEQTFKMTPKALG